MIREYQEGDLDGVLEVWHQASLIAHHFLDDAFMRQERETIATVYLPATETWVYVQEGCVTGFISLADNEVGAIFVDPAAQGKGIGRALMDHARALRGELVLDVFKQNRIGRRFYDRYGFELEREHVHQQTGHPMLRLRLGG